MFRTDLLAIIRNLNTAYTAIGICHAEILNVGKITSVYMYIYIYIQGVPGGMCQTSGECSLS